MRLFRGLVFTKLDVLEWSLVQVEGYFFVGYELDGEGSLDVTSIYGAS